MMNIDALHLFELFEDGITRLVEELNPERVFICYRCKDENQASLPRVYAAQGVSLANLYTAENVSTEIIRQALRDGKPEAIVDAMASPKLTDRNSVILSGLRSVMVIPLKHQNGLVVGLAYLDNRAKTYAFGDEELETARKIVTQLQESAAEAERRSLVDGREAVSTSDLASVKTQALAANQEGNTQEAMDKIEAWLKGRKSEGKEVGTAHGIRSRILESQGLERAAFSALAQAVSILGQAAVNPCPTYAVMLNNLAGFQVKRQNYRRALGLFTTAAEEWKNLGSQEVSFTRGLAGTSYNLGALYLKIGQETQANSWLANALDLTTETYGKDHPKAQKIRDTMLSQPHSRGVLTGES